MAKKFVRGITDIKNIEHQDFDTNNVNDLLSDGKHNYIHRKKQDGSEEYHNLTDNIKTIQSDDTDLVSVTNYNNTTNSATIRPKHDSQKEQVLESTDETILITHGENGTDETTNVDVNPEKVLEHDNLISNSEYITIEHEENSNTSVITTDELDSEISELKTKVNESDIIYQSKLSDGTWSWEVRIVCKRFVQPTPVLDACDMEVTLNFILPRNKQTFDFTLNENDAKILYDFIETFGRSDETSYNDEWGFRVKTNGCELYIAHNDRTTLKITRDEYQTGACFTLTYFWLMPDFLEEDNYTQED